jgi:hypothetical protein
MALTIAIEGIGVIANADAETNDTGGGGTGDWGFTGSGGVSSGITQDTFYYGSDAMSMALSGAKNGWLWFNEGTGIDFTAGTGAADGQHIYIWMHCPTIGLSDTLANAGVSIRIGSSTTDYRTYVVAGNDGSNGWDGKWKCFVIDPTKAGSIADGGTFDISAVTHFGIRGATTATAKGDNFFISQIAVGHGLRVTGTSTTGWRELVDYCTDLPNRAWGMMQEREGIFYVYGDVWIGDATQSADVSFADSGRILQFGVTEYYNGTIWVTSTDVDFYHINVEDHASWTTTLTDGVIVGTDQGRSGSQIIGNANHNVMLDLYGGLNTGSLVALYGTTFKTITGAINFGDDAQHRLFGVTFSGCGQVDPVGAIEIKNCNFAETTHIDSALLWNEDIDIADCNFIANTVGAAIEMPSSAGTPYSYSGLLFSGNTFDVLNSSGAAITINKTAGADPSTSEGSGVTFAASFDFTIEGIELNTEVTIVTADTTTVLYHLENAVTSDGGGKYKIVYTHSGGASVDALLHHIDYKPEISNIYSLSLPNADSTAKAKMFADENYDNP